jgi:hypothetical protein
MELAWPWGLNGIEITKTQRQKRDRTKTQKRKKREKRKRYQATRNTLKAEEKRDFKRKILYNIRYVKVKVQNRKLLLVFI